MSRHKFAARLGIPPDWDRSVSRYDVVQKELRRLRVRSGPQASNGRAAPETGKVKVLVDGVFYQTAPTGIARLWNAVLARLAQFPDLEITILDRGNCPDIDGLKKVRFPSYTGRHAPADSLHIDQIADVVGADVFVSTYYTAPTRVPSVLMVYDMIPEVLKFDLAVPMWREKEAAISFARRYVCISHNTKADLHRFYPEIHGDQASVAHCGVDHDIFSVRDAVAAGDFRKKSGLTKPYFIFSGSRGEKGSYKNAGLLFDAVKSFREADFDIVCTGGEPDIDRAFLDGMPATVKVRRLDLSDDELALAYSGALALVYPSLYEGFGLPVIEAMACGCPVITTRFGSLGEVADDAAMFVTGHDAAELGGALGHVRDPAVRRELIEKGLARAAGFDWAAMAAALREALRATAAERDDPDVQHFLRKWTELREIQRAVDIGS